MLCVNDGKFFRHDPTLSTRETVNTEPSQILCAIVVVSCCLTVGVADATTTDSAKSISIETNAGTDYNTVDKQPVQQSNASIPKTKLHVAVRANGSAVWTIHYHFRLGDANETAAFNRLRTDITSNPAPYRDRFKRRITAAVASAERTTGREMAVKNVSVRATRNGTTGVVTYEFVWVNFAASNDTSLRIGDVLRGFYLDNGTQLTIQWPDEYETTTVRPAPTERHPNAVVWAGSTVFNASEPFIELVRSNTTAGSTGPGNERKSTGTAASGNELPLRSIGMGVLILVVGILGIAWFVRRRQTDDSSTATVANDPEPESETNRETPAENVPPNSDDEHPTTAANDRPSLDLLSNEERVVEVFKRSDGRLKQQQVGEKLGWTDAKTSSVVSSLRENGTIEGFRLGRENVLRLSDEEYETDTDDTTNE